MSIQDVKDSQLSELYQKLDRLIATGEVANAYGGTQDFDDPDGDVLSEFIEFIDEFYSDNRPEWLEAFYQVFTWQFQSCHEGVATYYNNSNGLSDDQTIKKTANYLQHMKYAKLSQMYSMGMDATQSEYMQIDAWVNDNFELVWDFYVDILGNHKLNWDNE